MNRLVLDTNIVLGLLRESAYIEEADRRTAVRDPETVSILSIVSVGELRALGLKRGWGKPRLAKLTARLSVLPVAGINDAIVERYAEIDAYSQGKLDGRPLGGSARNMSKNDLWIAATASVTSSTLVTTDKDFDHLHGEFFEVVWIDPETPS